MFCLLMPPSTSKRASARIISWMSTIEKIVSTYQFRREEPRYSRRVPLAEIAGHDFNLNISRYISTAVAEKEIDLSAVHDELVSLERTIKAATEKHNEFLKELGLPLLP